MRVFITCEYCGVRKSVSECRSHLKHCSTACRYADKKVDIDRLKRLARMGKTRKEAAAMIDCSYITILRAIKQHNINHLFPVNGVASHFTKQRAIST